MALTEQYLIDYVRDQLGASFWKVELSPRQVTRAISNALKIYSRSIPEQHYAKIDITPTVNKYDLSETDTGFGVVRVNFTEPDPRPSAIFYANLLDVAPIRTSRFQDYDIFLCWRKTFMKVTSVKSDWEWDELNKFLWIYNPIDGYSATYWTWHLRTLTTVELVHEKWIEDYVLANCKHMLGMNRSKFQGAIPGPSKDISTDGKELRDEGKTEMKELEEKMFTMQMDGPPVFD